MPRGTPRSSKPDYDQSVFIYCPFDEPYLPLFRAVIFGVFACGLVPRCAQEVYDAGEVRIDKIARIVRACRWGMHDVSPTDLNINKLPRFNMPLELGLFLGACRFGDSVQRRKSCLVLNTERYRYQEFISDIAGQDVTSYANEPEQAVRAVRDWLAVSKAGVGRPPGGQAIAGRHLRFATKLPEICATAELVPDELTFVEFADIASKWLHEELGTAA